MSTWPRRRRREGPVAETTRMAALPQGLTREVNVDREHLEMEPWFRRAVLLAILGLLAAGLAGVFGQRPDEDPRAAVEAAALSLSAPAASRRGLTFEARFRIDARRRLERPTLVLDPGWFESISLSPIVPAPVEESGRSGGKVAFVFGPVPAGEHLVVWLDLSVNATAPIGVRDQDVVLEDDGQELASLDHALTVFP